MDMMNQVAMSKRIAILKLERNLTREDTFILDAATTIDFDDKVIELYTQKETSFFCKYYLIVQKNQKKEVSFSWFFFG